MSGDFLSRWSRRKREAVAEPKAAEGHEPPETGDSGPGVEGTAPVEDPMPQLPPLEALTAESDITAFLHAGVPASLRNAALRRMWSLDPAIRDFVGDARDYAWDWNVPGGVPGTGPLSVEEASGAVREMWQTIGGDPAAAEPPAPEPAVSAGADEPGPDEAPPETCSVAAEDAALSANPPFLANAPATPATAPEPSAAGHDPAPATPMRRHGGARPV